jgi:hypothetical protein
MRAGANPMRPAMLSLAFEFFVRGLTRTKRTPRRATASLPCPVNTSRPQLSKSNPIILGPIHPVHDPYPQSPGRPWGAGPCRLSSPPWRPPPAFTARRRDPPINGTYFPFLTPPALSAVSSLSSNPLSSIPNHKGASNHCCLQGVGRPREAASGFFTVTDLFLEVPINQ